MKKAHRLILLIVFPCIFTCCSKNKYCRIVINTPQDNQVFNGGAQVTIDAKIYDDGDAIMNEWLTVTSIPANDTIVNFKASEFTFEYPINISFTSAANTRYKIEVQARGGHGNWTSEIVNITCH